mmetsp:Transcript_32754/g.93921  ORF Transcript_32754/g.93921 Transcript_32754/m.93921 type:complete len:234 (-) Transcript_32754:887-1588(-)
MIVSLVFASCCSRADLAPTKTFRSSSNAMWTSSRTNSWIGRPSRSSKRRSQTFNGAYLHRCARCSWKRDSPTWRMVSSMLSMRPSSALHRSPVLPIFFRIVCVTTPEWELNFCADVCAVLLSCKFLIACLVKFLAWLSLSTVDCCHLETFSETSVFAERADGPESDPAGGSRPGMGAAAEPRVSIKASSSSGTVAVTPRGSSWKTGWWPARQSSSIRQSVAMPPEWSCSPGSP